MLDGWARRRIDPALDAIASRLAGAGVTPNAVTLALAFVTLPFIIRTVQPVLEELDTDVEQAAAEDTAEDSPED